MLAWRSTREEVWHVHPEQGTWPVLSRITTGLERLVTSCCLHHIVVLGQLQTSSPHGPLDLLTLHTVCLVLFPGNESLASVLFISLYTFSFFGGCLLFPAHLHDAELS